jgi:hypothetical protein
MNVGSTPLVEEASSVYLRSQPELELPAAGYYRDVCEFPDDLTAVRH